LHTAKDQLVVPSTSQDHGRKHCNSQRVKQVADQKDCLQAEPTGAGKDVTEPIGHFLQDVPLSFAACFGSGWLRDMDKE
jgi:hypothetical protein